MVVMSPIFLNGVPEPGILPLSGKLNFRPLTSTSFIGTLGNLAVMYGVSSRTGMSWLPRNLFQRSKKLREFHESLASSQTQIQLRACKKISTNLFPHSIRGRYSLTFTRRRFLTARQTS